MCACVHACIHKHMTYMHSYMHSHTRACTCMHACKHDVEASMHLLTHTRMDGCMHAHYIETYIVCMKIQHNLVYTDKDHSYTGLHSNKQIHNLQVRIKCTRGMNQEQFHHTYCIMLYDNALPSSARGLRLLV